MKRNKYSIAVGVECSHLANIVICSESKEHVEEKMESWRYALERRVIEVNRRNTELMCACACVCVHACVRRCVRAYVYCE